MGEHLSSSPPPRSYMVKRNKLYFMRTHETIPQKPLETFQMGQDHDKSHGKLLHSKDSTGMDLE